MTFVGSLAQQGERYCLQGSRSRAGQREADADRCWGRARAKARAALARGGEQWWRTKALVEPPRPSHALLPTFAPSTLVFGAV